MFCPFYKEKHDTKICVYAHHIFDYKRPFFKK